MNRRLSVFAATLLCALCSYLLFAQNPRQQMSFFVTSVGMGNGGNLGGLAGADRHCQTLAQAAGAANKTWRAYLSTQASGNQPAVNARDRIGQGPWQNADGGEVAVNLADLHGDSGQGAPVNRTVAITEKGQLVEGSKHDLLTGSQRDGRAYTDGMDHTCNNWTSNGAGSAQVGHHDRAAGGGEFGGGGRGGRRDEGTPSWNSSHATTGCGQEALASNGAGLFYCFAID
jgi:hypothetical protein